MKNFNDEKTHSVTVAEWAIIWLSTYRTAFSNATYETYFDTVQQYVLPKLGAYKLSEVCTAHISELINSNAHTALQILSTLTHMFEQAIANELVMSNPCGGIMFP